MTGDGDRSTRNRLEEDGRVDRRTFVRATGIGLTGAGGVGTVAGDGRLQTVQDDPWADVDYRGEQLNVPTTQEATISGRTNLSLFDEEIDIYVDSVDGEDPSFSKVAEGVIVEPPEPNEEFSVWETEFDFSGVPDWRDLEVTIELTETGEDITEDGPVPGRTVPGPVEFDIDRPVPVPEYETTFDASATGGAVESYQWEFGDDETAAGEVVTHAYSAAGTYVVELTVQRPDTENSQTVPAEFEVPETWADIDRNGETLELARLPGVTVSGTTSLDAGEQVSVELLSEVGADIPFFKSAEGIPVQETGVGEPNEWTTELDLHDTRDGFRISEGTAFGVDVRETESGSNITLGGAEIPGVVVAAEGLGIIDGRLADPGGDEFVGVEIDVYDGDGELVATTTTDETGEYTLTLAPGTYEVAIVDDRFGPSGAEVSVTEDTLVEPGIQVTPPALPGQNQPPAQAAAFPDDGLYENVTGDGSFDIFDVQALFDNLDVDPVQNGAWAYNFSGTDPGRVSIFDVQALFNRLQSVD